MTACSTKAVDMMTRRRREYISLQTGGVAFGKRLAGCSVVQNRRAQLQPLRRARSSDQWIEHAMAFVRDAIGIERMFGIARRLNDTLPMHFTASRDFHLGGPMLRIKRQQVGIRRRFALGRKLRPGRVDL